MLKDELMDVSHTDISAADSLCVLLCEDVVSESVCGVAEEALRDLVDSYIQIR